jgi:peptidoglycan lytic transglycosylase
MLLSKNVRPGSLTRSRMALAIIAATLLVGGSISQASAQSHHHQAHHQKAKQPSQPSNGFWDNARAAFAPLRTFSGLASYYGSESGSRTASGQRFNQGAMTAAHRTLPFGTKVKVTHGDRSVVVTINDRGPFVRGRVLDLSKGAARAIGLTGPGVGRVVAEVM